MLCWTKRKNKSYIYLVDSDKLSIGCSKQTPKQPLGCRPENRKCDDPTEILNRVSDELDSNLGGIQLTTSAVAKICYCDTNGCNNGNSDGFKIACSGFVVTLMGSFGIVGNLIAITILLRPEMKSSTNYILMGKMSTIFAVQLNQSFEKAWKSSRNFLAHIHEATSHAPTAPTASTKCTTITNTSIVDNDDLSIASNTSPTETEIMWYELEK